MPGIRRCSSAGNSSRNKANGPLSAPITGTAPCSSNAWISGTQRAAWPSPQSSGATRMRAPANMPRRSGSRARKRPCLVHLQYVGEPPALPPGHGRVGNASFIRAPFPIAPRRSPVYMGKNKLSRFAENATFGHVVQPTFTELSANDLPQKGRWNPDFFKRDAPLVLELGCGGGEYTVGLAQL